MIYVYVKCYECGHVKRLRADPASYMKWKSGRSPVNCAFPLMTPGDRAMIKEGVCLKCKGEVSKWKQD